MNEERFELDGAGIFDNKTNRFFIKPLIMKKL